MIDPNTFDGGVPEGMKGRHLFVLPYDELHTDELGHGLAPALMEFFKSQTKERTCIWTHRMKNNNLYILFSFEFEEDALLFKMRFG